MEQAEKREGSASDGDPTDAAEKRETTQRVEQEQPPPCKKTALEDLLGATFAKSTVTQSKLTCTKRTLQFPSLAVH